MGHGPSDRLHWAAGSNVPLASEHADFEVLYWVGCAAAYDRRVQKVARSVVRLLQAANVNFAVLGPEERCTGESARRMGDELLFQQLAATNVETLGRHGVRRIVAHCPHCVNSLRNDYPQAGGNYEVMHHSQLLAELVEQGRLPTAANDEHARRQDHVSRSVLPGAGRRSRRAAAASAFGRNQFERSIAARRAAAKQVSNFVLRRRRRADVVRRSAGAARWAGRVREIAESGADTVAVSCPFCLIMLGDGLAAQKPDMQVRDIAEVLAESVLGPEALSSTS